MQDDYWSTKYKTIKACIVFLTIIMPLGMKYPTHTALLEVYINYQLK